MFVGELVGGLLPTRDPRAPKAHLIWVPEQGHRVGKSPPPTPTTARDPSRHHTRPTQAPRWPRLEPPNTCCTQNAKPAGMRQPPAKPQHRTAAPPGTLPHTQLARLAHQATHRPHQPTPHSHSPVLSAPVPFWPQPRWRPCRWQQNRARPWQGQVHARPGPQGR